MKIYNKLFEKDYRLCKLWKYVMICSIYKIINFYFVINDENIN